MAGRVLQSHYFNSSIYIYIYNFYFFIFFFCYFFIFVSPLYRVVCLVVVDFWWLSVMEPYLFPECLICQVHAFGYPLRRGSLFCICLAIPVIAAVPGLLCTLTYSCPTGCSETDWHPWASEGSWALPLLSQIQLTGNSHSRWAVEIKPLGTWQLLWAAYCEI